MRNTFKRFLRSDGAVFTWIVVTMLLSMCVGS
jgi:hypothetical protein